MASGGRVLTRNILSDWPNCTAVGNTTELNPQQSISSRIIAFPYTCRLLSPERSLGYMSILSARWRGQPGRLYHQRHGSLREDVRRRLLQHARLGDHRFLPIRHERIELDQHVVYRERYVHEPEFELRPGSARARAYLAHRKIPRRDRPQVHGEGRQCRASPP